MKAKLKHLKVKKTKTDCVIRLYQKIMYAYNGKFEFGGGIGAIFIFRVFVTACSSLSWENLHTPYNCHITVKSLFFVCLGFFSVGNREIILQQIEIKNCFSRAPRG